MSDRLTASSFSPRRARDAVLGMVAGVVLNALAILVASKVLGPTERGVMVSLTLIPTAANILLGLGMPASNVYLVGSDEVQAGTATANSLAWSLVLPPVAGAVLWITGLGALAGHILHLPAKGVAIACAVSAPLLAYQTLGGVVQGVADFRVYRNGRLVQGAAVLTLALVLWAAHAASAPAFFVTWLVSYALGAVLFGVFGARRTRFGLSFRALRVGLKRGVGAMWTQAWDFVNLRGDQFLVSALAGPTVLGVYATGVAVTELLFHVPNALSMVVFAESSKAAEESRASLVAEDAGGLLPPLLIVGVMAAVATGLIVVPLIGEGFAAATAVVAILAVPVAALSTTRLLGAHEMGSGRLHVPGIAAALSLIVTFAVDLWSVPAFGAAGAALGCGIGYLAAAATLFGWSLRQHGSTIATSYAHGIRRSGTIAQALWKRAVRG